MLQAIQESRESLPFNKLAYYMPGIVPDTSCMLLESHTVIPQVIHEVMEVGRYYIPRYTTKKREAVT